MSSNISVLRICQFCGTEFTAKTTVTKYCSDKCSKRAYKARQKVKKIEVSNKETYRIKTQPIEEIKAKEFLTVRDTATLLNFSIRTTYRLIENGTIKAVNLSERLTRVKRSEIDKLLEKPQSIQLQSEPLQFQISDCYNLTEVQEKYGISEKALHDLIKRNSVPKIKRGWYAYVPKTEIDKLLRK